MPSLSLEQDVSGDQDFYTYLTDQSTDGLIPDYVSNGYFSFGNINPSTPHPSHYVTGLRFQIPLDLTNITIDSVNLSLIVFGGSNGNASLIETTISAEASDNASLPTDRATVITKLSSQTTAIVNWTPTTSSMLLNSANLLTVDLTSILTELLGRGGWTSGNYIVLYIVTTAPPVSSYAEFPVYGKSGTSGTTKPKLIINYTNNIPGSGSGHFVESDLTVVQTIYVQNECPKVTDILTVNQTISWTRSRNPTVTSVVVVAQDVSYQNMILLDVEQFLSVVQVISVQRIPTFNVEHVINITQDIIRNALRDKENYDAITVNQDISFTLVHNKTVTDILTVTQTIHSSLIQANIVQFIDIQQIITVSGAFQNANNVESILTVDQTIVTNRTGTRDVESDITIQQLVLVTGYLASGDVTIPATYGVFTADNYSATNPTSQGSQTAKNRPDTHYNPVRVSGSSMRRTVSTTETHSTVLEYPFSSTTVSLTLPSPVFGNREELQVTRIQRKALGGDIKVFTDTNWPRIKTLRFQFEHVNDTLLSSYYDFILLSLGLEIRLTDYEGRVWKGFIVTPETESTDVSKANCENTIGFEFIGVEQ